MKIFILFIIAIAAMVFLKQQKDASIQKDFEVQNPQVPLQPTPAPESNKNYELCRNHSKCAGLREYQAKCHDTNALRDCRVFVKLFKSLSAVADCKRHFDKSPVPSVWLCDEDPEENIYPKLLERSAKTLSELKYPFATEFYHSEAFRSILDGDLAETHYQKSLGSPDK